ncbi:putative BPI/LBP family protein At1g04970 [Andrographis paniculata]|uniref:putative BPI/LBP family protein At1g04970 n=1 Tax=Andrographis paniculata TaxID=175694 RepID=UPI0021E923B9|nr:putative BPI/LBP family protein At1g04970 [Andrographis paniculata]
MASSNLPFPFLVLYFSAFFYLCVRSQGGGYIVGEISTKGIDFVKDLLIEKVEASLVPLGISDIEKAVKIPLIGKVHMVLSNITVDSIHLGSSTVETGSSGVVVKVSGATANLSMNWKYWYTARLIPVSISDEGSASVQVEDMEVVLNLTLKTVEGSLAVALVDCGCYVNDISITLVGGASWLYQGLVDAFQSKISSAVEDGVSKKINSRIVKLDSLLQSLPKEVPATDIAYLNVTLVDDPKLSESSVNVEINGLFFTKHEITLSSHSHRSLEPSLSCEESDEMAKVSIHEKVLQSASSVYYKANKMHWIVEEAPNESLLNTSEWRFIIPQLYKMYPNRAMNLNISASSPPTIKLEKQQVVATTPFDVVIGVLDELGAIPIACISTVISSSLTAEFSGNDAVTGTVKLNNFTMHLRWSDIGNLHIDLLQGIISTMVRTVVVPYINVKFSGGYHIPAFHGYGLQRAHIHIMDSWIVICSDVARVKQLVSII